MSFIPIIALTMGDPAGIGPEIIVKAFQDDMLPLQSRVLVIGDARLLQETAKKFSPEVLIHPIRKPEEGWYQTCTIDVIDLKNVPENFPVGRPSSEAGQASYEAIKAAVDLAIQIPPGLPYQVQVSPCQDPAGIQLFPLRPAPRSPLPACCK